MSGPGPVQVFHRPVLLLQPLDKPVSGRGAVRKKPAAQLVAQAKGQQRRMGGVPLGHHSRQPVGVLPEMGISHILHIAGMGVLPDPLPVHNVDGGILPVKPGGSRPGGNIQKHPDAPLLAQLHHPVHPGEGVNALLRLKAVPAQVAQPDHVKAPLGHHVQVLSPALRGPVVRVIVGSNIKCVLPHGFHKKRLPACFLRGTLHGSAPPEPPKVPAGFMALPYQKPIRKATLFFSHGTTKN